MNAPRPGRVTTRSRRARRRPPTWARSWATRSGSVSRGSIVGGGGKVVGAVGVRNVVPSLLNGLVSLQKDVALVGVLGVRDAVREADVYKARSFNYTPFVVAAILFLLVSVPLARFTDWYTERDRRLRSKDHA